MPGGFPPASSSVRTFWVLADQNVAGLLRVLDLDDIGDGSPVFDLRIASRYRGHGIGQKAVHRMTTMLFESYPELHRIEGTTRVDNVAMRKVIEVAGFQLEGQLRETWPTEDGHRFDTALYGLLRRDWERSH